MFLFVNNLIFKWLKINKTSLFSKYFNVFFSFLHRTHVNLDKMLELSTDSTMPADFNENFLIKRNVVMVKNFIKISKKQSLFCAVGAAHLAGEDGVLELLRKKGYTVEPVFFKWTEN